MNNVQQRITEWSAKRRVRQMRDRILALLLTVMMIVGMFASVMPAVAAEEAFCGLEEHTHSDDCYKENRELICELPESLHVHTDACYAETRVLKCGQIETEGHIHTDDCYEERTTYMCGLEEYEGHTHTDGCYTEQTCLVCDNTDPEHEHDESCYITESVLTCGIPESEGHTHTDGCLGVEKVLVCGLEEHDPHTHDDTCYTTEIVLSCGLKEGEPEHVHTEDCYKITRELICEQAEHVHTSACFEDASTEMPVFSQSKTVDDVVVSVTAPEGVFPAEATLSVTKVPVQAQTMVDAAVEAERSENVNVAVSYTFDIKVLDAEGYELQPAEGQGVNVSFTLAAAQDSNLKASVYHVDERGASAVLDAETQGGTVTAATDGFSYYTVEFTYQNLQYVLSGGGSVALDTVLSTVGLTGEVANAYGSNDSLFSVSNSTGEWIVTSHEAFDSTESLMVLINGVEYVITVTDDNTWAGGTIKLEFGFASSADRHVQYSNYDPSVPWENNDNHPWFTYHSWVFLPYWPGSATLYNSAGRVVESYTNETRHEFKNLPAGEYTIKLDSLDEGIYSIYQGVHNGAPRSQIIIWSEDSPLLKVTVREGDTANILRWVVLEYKVYGFKTVTDVGTFGPATNTATPGQPSADGKEYVYYGGGSWGVEDYPNPETYIPYVQTKDGIYWGDSASQYRGMGSLQIPTLSDAEKDLGYKFKGWKLEGDNSGKIYTDWEARNYTVKGNVVFRAVWELPQCTVTFDPNGGAGNMDSVTVSTGSYTLPENGFIAPEGKAFNGWDRGSAGSNINISENITLLAQWAEDANGDDIPDNKQVLIKYVAGANGSYTGDEYDVFTAVGDEVSIDNVASTGRTAVPNTEYALDKWSNSKNSDTNQTGAFTFGTVDVDTIITVTASFADDNNAILATLTYGTDGNGSVTEWYFGGDATADQTLARDDLQAMIDHFAGNELVGQGLKNADINETGGFNSLDRTLFANLVTNGSSMLPNQDFIFSVTDIPNDGYYVSRVTVNGQELNVPEVTSTTNAYTTIDGANYRVYVTWVDGEFVYTIRGTSLAVNDVWIEHSESNKYTMSRATDGFGQITSYRFGGDATVDDVVDWRDRFYINGFMGDGGPTWNRQFAINACLVKGNLSKDPEELGRVTNNDWIFLSDILSGAQDPYDERSLTYYCFSWEVVDEPIDGYYVSAVSLNNQQLTVPDIGGSATTEVEGQVYTVSINADGVATVSGPNLAVNDVYIAHASAWAEGSIGVEFGWVSPDSYRTAMLYPRGAFMSWGGLPYWSNGAAELLDSAGNTLGSFTGESSHKFTGLKAGKYILRVTPLKPDSVYNAVESITGVSVITDYETEIEIAEGAVGTIWKYVVVEYKAYAFKTTTEIGTFASGGQAQVYYPGGNWAYENTDPASVSRCATFNTHDGIYYKDTASQYNLSVLEIPTLSEEEAAKGYKFVGWKLVENGDLSEKIYTDVEALSYVVRGDTEFRAVWEYPTHTVSFSTNADCGAINGDTSVSFQMNYNNQTMEGEGIALPEVIVKPGYEFIGWYSDLTTNVIPNETILKTKVDRDLNYYAKYKGSEFTVKYLPGTDGSITSNFDELRLANGTYIPSVPTVKANTGASFTGKWKVVAISDGAALHVGDVLDESDIKAIAVSFDMNLEAQYEKENLTVAFDSDGGTPVDSQNVLSGDKADKPNDPTKDGYTFNGWTLDGREYDFDAPVIDNITLVAKWIANTDTGYVVEFYYQSGGVYGTQPDKSEVRSGTTDTEVSVTDADKTPDPAKTGFVLDEVMNDFYTGSINGDGTLVLKVYFKQQFTVVYDPGEHGTWAAADKTISGIDYGKPTPSFSGDTSAQHDAGYTFSGWTPSVADTVTMDVTYVAQWTANEGSQYTVEYYYQENGTYPATASSSVSRTGDVGTEVSITDEDKAPSRSGYAIDETLNDFFTGTVADDGSLVLKVYFKQQFTVVYEPGAHGTWEAASATTEKLNYGVATPAFSGNVSSDHDAGYHFVSWTPSVADTVTVNAVYVAQWAADSETRYKVEYYYQVNGVYPQTANKSVDRTGITDKTVQVTATDKTPDRNGYALDNAAANVLSGIVAADGSLVLKVYFKQQFTITYNMNGGTMNGSTASVKETHDYGEVISILKAPTRSGYTFQYWKGSEYQPGENYTVTGDHTFTAQWSANSAKLPKTGQTTWPIPVFTVMGTALIVYGLIRRKKEEKENAS